MYRLLHVSVICIPYYMYQWYVQVTTCICDMYRLLHVSVICTGYYMYQWYVRVITRICDMYTLLHVSVRVHPKMSTFSWVYIQYTFSDPLHPKVCKPTFWGSKTRVSCSTTFIVQQQKLTCLRSLLCDKWYLWLRIVIYRLQLIWHTSKFNLKIYFLCIRKYVQFHNIKF